MFRRWFWWSLLGTIPAVATSHMVVDWLGYSLGFPGMGLIGPGLGGVLFLCGGSPFLTGGWREARSRQPGMMLLISMAIKRGLHRLARHQPRLVGPGVLVGALRPDHRHAARPLAGIRRLEAETQASRSRAQALADRSAALLFYVATGLNRGRTGRRRRGADGDSPGHRLSPRPPPGHRTPLQCPGCPLRDPGKDRPALERMRTVDAVLFDKTGTLT